VKAAELSLDRLIAGIFSALRQRFRDCRLHPRVGWLDGGGKDFREIAVTADQIFVKVPARNLVRPRLRRPFVEGVRVRPDNDGLGRDREGNPI
jgi:hypothetical protein